MIGDGFIAIPAQRRSNRKLDLFVLDLASRRTLLENDANVLSLPYRQRFRMDAIGGHVVLQTGDGIAILGEESPPK